MKRFTVFGLSLGLGAAVLVGVWGGSDTPGPLAAPAPPVTAPAPPPGGLALARPLPPGYPKRVKPIPGPGDSFNCHAGTLKFIVHYLEQRGMLQNEIFDAVHNKYQNKIKVPKKWYESTNALEIQAVLDTFFEDRGGWNSRKGDPAKGEPNIVPDDMPDKELNELLDFARQGRLVVLGFTPEFVWPTRGGDHNFYFHEKNRDFQVPDRNAPGGVRTVPYYLKFAHSAVLEAEAVITPGGTSPPGEEVQIRSTARLPEPQPNEPTVMVRVWFNPNKPVLQAAHSEVSYYYAAKMLNDFRREKDGVPLELATFGRKGVFGDRSDLDYPIKDPKIPLINEPLKQRNIAWPTVHVYVAKGIPVYYLPLYQDLGEWGPRQPATPRRVTDNDRSNFSPMLRRGDPKKGSVYDQDCTDYLYRITWKGQSRFGYQWVLGGTYGSLGGGAFPGLTKGRHQATVSHVTREGRRLEHAIVFDFDPGGPIAGGSQADVDKARGVLSRAKSAAEKARALSALDLTLQKHFNNVMRGHETGGDAVKVLGERYKVQTDYLALMGSEPAWRSQVVEKYYDVVKQCREIGSQDAYTLAKDITRATNTAIKGLTGTHLKAVDHVPEGMQRALVHLAVASENDLNAAEAYYLEVLRLEHARKVPGSKVGVLPAWWPKSLKLP